MLFCSRKKNDSVVALSPAEATLLIKPTSPFFLSVPTNPQERNCDPCRYGHRALRRARSDYVAKRRHRAPRGSGHDGHLVVESKLVEHVLVLFVQWNGH